MFVQGRIVENTTVNPVLQGEGPGQQAPNGNASAPVTLTYIVAQPYNPYQQFQALPTKKKQCCGAGCCAFSIITFLLLFFLIPRLPRVQYISSSASFNPYTVSQTYKVYNRNMYSLTWKNWDMTVSTSTNSGTFTSGNGQLDDDDDSFVVAAHSTKEFTLVYVYNITSAQQQSITTQCFSSAGVTYKTTGSVDMDMWYHDFTGLDLGPWTTTYYC